MLAAFFAFIKPLLPLPYTFRAGSSYYSITGQRVDNIENERGLFIKMNLMSDGTTHTSKIIKY